MRKVIYGGACSLDGFLTDATGQVDWIHFSKDVQAIMATSWATTDTVLFGRKTWQVAQAMGGGPTGLKVKTYVFDRDTMFLGIDGMGAMGYIGNAPRTL